MSAVKKPTLLAAVSAVAVIAGFAAQPALANDWGRICEHCAVDWHFTNRDIDLTISPDDFHLAAISSVTTDQLFVGSLDATASVTGIGAGSGVASNTASSVANVISIAGDGGKSPFGGVVDAVQHTYGTLNASASLKGGGIVGDGTGLTNSATAAANVISLDTSRLALVDVEQTVGSRWAPATLTSSAELGHVGMRTSGDASSAASSVANVISVNVAPATAGALPRFSSLALVDVQQTTFANLTSVASATRVGTGGSFSNAATSAANVISVINKK